MPTLESSTAPLRIALDARIPEGQWGGVQHVVEGLAHGLREVDGPDEFLFLTERDGAAWLRPSIGGGTSVVEVPAGYGRTRLRRAYDGLASTLPAAARVARSVGGRLASGAVPVARSDGFVERLGVDLVHFTTPQAFLTVLPSLYQPHDLLHRHHPEQFSAVHARYRDQAYRTFSAQAAVVAVMTEFGRADLVRAFDLPAERVAVVPLAPVAGLGGQGASSETAGLPDLPERFVLYPAQTWPHKNHVRLIEALAALRDRGMVIPLICTGRQTEHMPAIQRRIIEFDLADQVRFTGYVSPAALDALYRRATALVFPSRFEGWGLPVVEAFAFDVPVACSNTTALPEVAAGAALLFDPDDTASMATALARVWQDDALRDQLRERGRRRAAELSWSKTARTFRAIYRRILGRALSDEDRSLLAPPTFAAVVS
jgi:glycosyltransferase involved in cell wall biosynthesis